MFLDELEEFSLAEHRVAQVEPGEFNLPRVVDAERIEVPVIQRTVVFEFQRAN